MKTYRICAILFSFLFFCGPIFSADCHFAIPGDFNRDCVVDIADLARFAAHWLVDCRVPPVDPACAALDLDGDGFDALTDCDDTHPGIYPGATEICNGIDDNCNGIVDEDCIWVVYVSKIGDDANPGSLESPKLTIQAAVDQAYKQGVANVFVSEGIYVEQILLHAGVTVHGGYSGTFYARDSQVYATTIQSPLPDPSLPGTVNGIGVQAGAPASTGITGFAIKGYDNTSPGGTAYALYLRDCDDSLTIQNNTIIAGSAGHGAAGTPGTNGLAGMAGGSGMDALDLFVTYGLSNHTCSPQYHSPGGAGGAMTYNAINISGGHGGQSICPLWDASQNRPYPPSGSEQGQPGQNGSALGGDSGWDVYHQAFSCAGFTTYGRTTGQNGMNGSNGNHGSGGSGSANLGTVIGGRWSVPAGTNGQAGQPGGGGGGGGAGAGAYVHGSCSAYGYGGDNMGGTGGGGGSGGQPGTGGAAGTSGGSTFAVFVTFKAEPKAIPQIVNNEIYGGSGGNGANGGPGGLGASGGTGGAGGVGLSVPDVPDPVYPSFDGGKGGDGGAGGHGGGGGGGAGGNSYCIYVHNSGSLNLTGYLNNNFYPGTGGLPGSGGMAIINPGTDGKSGVSAATNF